MRKAWMLFLFVILLKKKHMFIILILTLSLVFHSCRLKTRFERQLNHCQKEQTSILNWKGEIVHKTVPNKSSKECICSSSTLLQKHAWIRKEVLKVTNSTSTPHQSFYLQKEDFKVTFALKVLTLLIQIVTGIFR